MLFFSSVSCSSLICSDRQSTIRKRGPKVRAWFLCLVFKTTCCLFCVIVVACCTAFESCGYTYVGERRRARAADKTRSGLVLKNEPKSGSDSKRPTSSRRAVERNKKRHLVSSNACASTETCKATIFRLYLCYTLNRERKYIFELDNINCQD